MPGSCSKRCLPYLLLSECNCAIQGFSIVVLPNSTISLCACEVTKLRMNLVSLEEERVMGEGGKRQWKEEKGKEVG